MLTVEVDHVASTAFARSWAMLLSVQVDSRFAAHPLDRGSGFIASIVDGVPVIPGTMITGSFPGVNDGWAFAGIVASLSYGTYAKSLEAFRALGA